MEIDKDILVRLLKAVIDPAGYNTINEYGDRQCHYCWNATDTPRQENIIHEQDCVILLAEKLLADLNTGSAQ